MPFGLTEETIHQIQLVFQQFHQMEEAVVYGSRAKGNDKPGSDIDLVLKGQELNLQVLNAISLKLDDLYLPYRFDLAIFHHINLAELLDHIRRVGKVFYRKPATEIAPEC